MFTRSSYSINAACDDSYWDCRQALSEYQIRGRYYEAVCVVTNIISSYPNPPRYPDYPRYPDPREPRYPDPREPRYPDPREPRRPNYPAPRPTPHEPRNPGPENPGPRNPGPGRGPRR